MTTELERLRHGVKADQKPGGMGTVRFIAKCNGDAEAVLSISKTVLITILELTKKGCSDESVWASLLPKRFVDACPPFPSPEEMEAYERLPLEERVERDRTEGWPLRAVMNAFLVLERWWSWWDAVVLDRDHVVVAVQVSEWPFPWEVLRWVLRGSGAIDVEPEP